jgi:hypothetical protein
MKKKLITTSLLGLIALVTTPVSATEQIAFQLGVYPVCTGCHTNGTLSSADKGNLMAAANSAYKKDKSGLTGLKTFLAGSVTPTTPKCTSEQVLNAAKTACVAKPATAVKNTKPVLSPVAQQWDVQVGEMLKIPLTVVDAEQDEFVITTSKLAGSSLSDVYQNDTGLPTIDFEWTPTQANVNKIQTLSFQAKEKSTKQKYTSNKIAVKVRVWAEGDRNNASITKLNVMTSKFSGGNLNLAGNVKFNNLLTATERQAFIEQTLDLTVNDANGSPINSSPLTLDKQGKWTVSIPMTSAPCDITLEFAGQNASRKVIGICTK